MTVDGKHGARCLGRSSSDKKFPPSTLQKEGQPVRDEEARNRVILSQTGCIHIHSLGDKVGRVRAELGGNAHELLGGGDTII